MVYSLVVTIKAKSEEAVDTMLTKMQPLITYSQTKESGTLSYEVARPQPQEGEAKPEKPTFIVMERYTNKAALEAHLNSPLFKETIAWIEANTKELEVETVFQHFDEAPSKKEPVANQDEERPPGVLVFCGSREGKDPLYLEKATELGKLLAEQKKPLVYGGGTVGLMGAVAKGCHKNGGEVTGIIPRALIPREATADAPFKPIYVDTMATRKSKMFELSGTVISMPGGMGTFDELLEVLTLFQLNAYRPKIGLLNVKGFYDPFLSSLDAWIEAGFVNADAKNYMVVSAEPKELLAGLDAHVPPPSVKKLEWTAKP